MSANEKQKNSRRAAQIRFEAGWFPACISEFVQHAHPFTADFYLPSGKLSPRFITFLCSPGQAPPS